MYLYIPTWNSFADDGLGCQLSFLCSEKDDVGKERERESGGETMRKKYQREKWSL